MFGVFSTLHVHAATIYLLFVPNLVVTSEAEAEDFAKDVVASFVPESRRVPGCLDLLIAL